MGKINRQLLNKCECCGALFQGDDCEYCKARYNFYEEEKIEKNKDTKQKKVYKHIYAIDDHHITLSFGGKECDFYVAEYGFESISVCDSDPIMSVRLVSYGRWRDVDENNVE